MIVVVGNRYPPGHESLASVFLDDHITPCRCISKLRRLFRKCSGIGLQGGPAPPTRTVRALAKRTHSFEVTSSPEPRVASAGCDPPAIFMCVGACPAPELLSPKFWTSLRSLFPPAGQRCCIFMICDRR